MCVCVYSFSREGEIWLFWWLQMFNSFKQNWNQSGGLVSTPPWKDFSTKYFRLGELRKPISCIVKCKTFICSLIFPKTGVIQSTSKAVRVQFKFQNWLRYMDNFIFYGRRHWIWGDFKLLLGESLIWGEAILFIHT